jgi:hypothetical protein
MGFQVFLVWDRKQLLFCLFHCDIDPILKLFRECIFADLARHFSVQFVLVYIPILPVLLLPLLVHDDNLKIKQYIYIYVFILKLLLC